MGLAAQDLMLLAQQVANHVTEAAGTRAPIDRRMVVERKYDIMRLQAVHQEILRLKLAGLKNVDIAKRLNCTEAVVSYTINSTLGRQKLSMMQCMRDESATDFHSQVDELVPQCMEIYQGIIDGSLTKDIKLRKQTADTIVKDLAGKAAPTKFEGHHMHMHMTPEDIEKMKERGLKSAIAAGVVVQE